MTVLDLGAIDAAPLQTDPFDFLVVPGCIRPDDLTAINGDYPNIDRPGNLNPEDTRYGPLFQGFLQELEGEELARHLGRKFGVDLTGCGTTVTVRKYCEQSDGNIHTDHPSKIITVLVYFNEGWANPEGQLRMLRSSSDIEDYAAEVPPLGGILEVLELVPPMEQYPVVDQQDVADATRTDVLEPAALEPGLVDRTVAARDRRDFRRRHRGEGRVAGARDRHLPQTGFRSISCLAMIMRWIWFVPS